MKSQRIFVVGHQKQASCWIDGWNTDDIAKATLVLFTGGTDINASIYGKRANFRNEPSDYERDAYEKSVFAEANLLGLPCVGICRGAQLLCALSGGVLVQHQNHPTKHDLITSCGRTITVNSCHHQRAYPFVAGCDFKLLAWAPDGTSPFHYGETSEDEMDGQKEAEVVYYPKTKSLGIQSHPEWLHPAREKITHMSQEYMRSLVDALCEEKLS